MGINVERTKSQTLDLICKIRVYLKETKKSREKSLSYITDEYDKDILLKTKQFFEEDDYIVSVKELQPKTFEVLLQWR